MVEDLEVDRTHLDLQELIGTGVFGEVWRGTYKGADEVAVKVLKPTARKTPRHKVNNDGNAPTLTKTPKELFVQEAMNLAHLMHPKILHIYGICSDIEPMYLITEYLPNGDLESYLMQMGPDCLPFINLVDILAQVSQ